MNKGTGVLGIFLAVGGLLVSASNSKTAEARPSITNLRAFTTPPTTLAAPVSVGTTPSGHAVVATPVEGEQEGQPHLLENRKLRRMQKSEISPAMSQMAAQIVRKHYAKPVGTEIAIEVGGKQVIARIERHFHPEGGPLKPWGFHPGVSLFVLR